jgi:hypothetical protein
MCTITIDIPEEIVTQYHTVEAVRQAIYEDFVASEYAKGHLSLRQGARLLGLTYEAFMLDFLGSRKLSFINSTPAELETEAVQENVWLDEILGAK